MLQPSQTPAVIMPSLLTRAQAAEFLGLKPQTLAIWACNRRYRLPFIKVGARARYRLEDLDRFLAERTVGGER